MILYILFKGTNLKAASWYTISKPEHLYKNIIEADPEHKYFFEHMNMYAVHSQEWQALLLLF